MADEILPQLRRSRLTLNYEIIGKSDEEIAKLTSSNPSELNVEELLYAATLTNDPAKQEAIYTQATNNSLTITVLSTTWVNWLIRLVTLTKQNLISRKLPALTLLLKLT